MHQPIPHDWMFYGTKAFGPELFHSCGLPATQAFRALLLANKLFVYFLSRVCICERRCRLFSHVLAAEAVTPSLLFPMLSCGEGEVLSLVWEGILLPLLTWASCEEIPDVTTRTLLLASQRKLAPLLA